MKKLFCILTIINCLNGYSQTLAERSKEKLIDQAQDILSKPLYVVTYNDNEDDDFIRKLTKKHKVQEIENFKRLTSSYNTFIKKAVDEMLTMFPSVKYITIQEYKKMWGKNLKQVNVIARGFSSHIEYQYYEGGDVRVEPKIENIQMDTLNTKQKTIVRFKTMIKGFGIPTFDTYYEKECSQLFASEADIRSAVLNIKWKIEEDLKK